MKITCIKIKGLFDQTFDVYLKADNMATTCDDVFCDACDLAKAIDFLFLKKTDGLPCDGMASVDFLSDGKKYTLSRAKNFDNVASLLKEQSDGKTNRYTNVDEKLKALFKTDLNKLFDGIVIEAEEFDKFNQNPAVSYHKDIADLFAVSKQTQEAYNQALDRKNQLKLQIKAITSQQIKPIKASDLEAQRNQTNELQKQYIEVLNQIEVLKDELRLLNTQETLSHDIAVTQDHINRLKENSQFINEKRQQLEEHRKIQEFLPQLKELLSYKKQLADTKQSGEKASEELEWLKTERQGLVSQLDELNQEIGRKTEQNTRLMLIRQDNESVESLAKRNEELADKILQLQSDKESLEQVREGHKTALDSIDKSIEEAKDSLKAIDVPVSSINELVDNVRTSVRIKEVEKQIENIEKEIVFVAKQMGEREVDIKKMQDTVTTLIKVDGMVTPFKSKDTILQILQSKINKSEVILQSLTEKQHNLREEIQNLHYKEIELDQSVDCLQTILSQKQYDRDMVIKKQALSEQQALPLANGMVPGISPMVVAPTTVAFIDEHIESIKSDLVRRNNKKLDVVSRQAGLKYVLGEVERQRQIVLGDVVTCRNERDAITRRFRDLAKTANNDVINKYFQALEMGKATTFVLDAQRTLVESQTQLDLYKEKYHDLIREKKEVMSRLGALSEMQKALDLKQMTVDMMVESNEEIKSTLVDLTEKLMLLHTQRKIESDGLEGVDLRIANVVTLLNEELNEKKANEKEILKIHQKISMFAKGDPDEAQQVAQEKVNELLSERRLLEESKADIDDKILAKNIEIEKCEVMLSTLMSSYQAKKESAQKLVKDLGDDDIEAIKLKNLSDEVYNETKTAVSRFDTTLETLTSRLEQLEEMRDQNKDAEKQAELLAQIEVFVQQSQDIKTKLEESKLVTTQMTDQYILSDKMRYDLNNLLNQYNSNKSLDVVVQQNQVVKLVVEQEINKILTSASRIFATMCGDGEIVCVDDKFALKLDNKVIPFADLSLSDKVCIFLSIKLCDMQVKFPQCKTVLLHGKLSLNKQEVATRLANLKKNTFVVEALSTDIA